MWSNHSRVRIQGRSNRSSYHQCCYNVGCRRHYRKYTHQCLQNGEGNTITVYTNLLIHLPNSQKTNKFLTTALNKLPSLTSPVRGRGYSNHRVCLCVCLSVTVLAGAPGTWRAIGILLKMFSSRVMTVFSSPRKLYLVLMPQNRHQWVTSAVTTLLVRQAWRPAIPTTTNQAAQTEHELAS